MSSFSLHRVYARENLEKKKKGRDFAYSAAIILSGGQETPRKLVRQRRQPPASPAAHLAERFSSSPAFL